MFGGVYFCFAVTIVDFVLIKGGPPGVDNRLKSNFIRNVLEVLRGEVGRRVLWLER